ncbi:MAG: hypothetical protein IH880_00955 [Candidatus Marinimicrobia bacterium]|nr:hypothetical protein [Candidatus Neomarinimicrobiota bacterium]
MIKAQNFLRYQKHEYSVSDTLSIQYKSPRGAMIRSAILPGWGQAYNHKFLKALVYMGGEVYFATKYIELNDELKILRIDYEKTGQTSITQKDLDDKEHERNGWGWLFTAGYLLAIGDAFVDAHLYGLNVNNDISVEVGSDVDKNSLMLQINMDF